MSLRIYTIQDPEVRKQSVDILPNELHTAEMRQFTQDLAEAMIQYDGVGIAAPQVGKTIKMIVVSKDFAETPEHIVLVNPRVVSVGNKTSIMEEGCLSVPGIYGMVERPTKTRVKAVQLNGESIDIKAKGMFARILLHEIDHLHGVLFIDKAIELTQQEKKSQVI